LTYDEESHTVTVTYNAWEAAGYSLTGVVSVMFKDAQRVSGTVAYVNLIDFSIADQRVKGEATITYRGATESGNDRYSYTLLDGAQIHETGSSHSVLISCRIAGGDYERVAGGETWALTDDDIWKYSGTMTGRLGKDQKLAYTNTVLTSYMGEDGSFLFSTYCPIAARGIAQIKVAGRPDILFGCNCSDIEYITVTHIK
jgi:hypothetical protein